MFHLFKKKEEDNNSQGYNPNEACITCSHVLEEKAKADGNSGKGLELKKFIQDGIHNIIQKDIQDKKVLTTQLHNNGEIVYENGRNGTWFDWQMNEKTSNFIVCFNDKKRMGYISIAVYNDGNVSGYKWGNYGKDEAESIHLGNLSAEDTNYLLRLLLQQADDENIFDKSIGCIDWEASIFLEDLEEAEDEDNIE